MRPPVPRSATRTLWGVAFSPDGKRLAAGGTRRTVGWSEAGRLEFSGGNQLLVFDTVFRFKNLPFREAGLYEFCVTSEGQVLGGERAELRVLDRRMSL